MIDNECFFMFWYENKWLFVKNIQKFRFGAFVFVNLIAIGEQQDKYLGTDHIFVIFLNFI